MGKPRTLPMTKAESAEERLEEIIKSKSMLNYKLLLNRTDTYTIYIRDGECRSYPDGFEAIESEGRSGILYVQRRNALIFYDFRKESEKQSQKE